MDIYSVLGVRLLCVVYGCLCCWVDFIVVYVYFWFRVMIIINDSSNNNIFLCNSVLKSV